MTASATPAPSGMSLLSAYRPEVLQAYLDLSPLLGRSLEPVTRELVRIAVQVAGRSYRALRCSVPRALAQGATPEQVIDAVTLALPEAGMGRVSDALAVVAEYVGDDRSVGMNRSCG